MRIVVPRLHGLASENAHPSRNEASRHRAEILLEAGARVFLAAERAPTGDDQDRAVLQGRVGVRQRAQAGEEGEGAVVIVMVADPGDLVVEFALIEIGGRRLLDRDICDVEADVGELIREAAPACPGSATG